MCVSSWGNDVSSGECIPYGDDTPVGASHPPFWLRSLGILWGGFLPLQRIKVTYGSIVTQIRIRGVGVSEKAYNPDSVSIFIIRGSVVDPWCSADAWVVKGA